MINHNRKTQVKIRENLPKVYLTLPAKISLLFIFLTLLSLGSLHATETAGLAALHSGKHFAMMRHALAPGFGDPANFELRGCSTQRNLSKEGFEQAARIGERFRNVGIRKAQVFTSQWCRCIDTAKTLGIGTPEELPAINSFFANPERSDRQTEELKQWLAKQDLSKPLVLVAHQVNMTALTGAYPASGEIFVIQRDESGEFKVTDKIQTE